MVIGVSGKAGSGKNLVGDIIQYLTSNDGQQKGTFEECEEYGFVYDTTFQLKSFADKLKDIVCMLINCTREQLEDREFKESFLGEEWNKFVSVDFPEMTGEDIRDSDSISVTTTYERLTPRRLLQLLGTECGRNIIHPNIWVNALMSEYKTCEYKCLKAGTDYCGDNKYDCTEVPNWIITDMRGGITIRINRPGLIENNHLSETSLDNAEFDYVIDNNGTIEELIEKVKEILIKENII